MLNRLKDLLHILALVCAVIVLLLWAVDYISDEPTSLDSLSVRELLLVDENGVPLVRMYSSDTEVAIEMGGQLGGSDHVLPYLGFGINRQEPMMASLHLAHAGGVPGGIRLIVDEDGSLFHLTGSRASGVYVEISATGEFGPEVMGMTEVTSTVFQLPDR